METGNGSVIGAARDFVVATGGDAGGIGVKPWAAHEPVFVAACDVGEPNAEPAPAVVYVSPEGLTYGLEDIAKSYVVAPVIVETIAVVGGGQ